MSSKLPRQPPEVRQKPQAPPPPPPKTFPEKKMAKPLEATIEKDFVLWCKARGLLCLKLVIAGSKGFPDRTVFLPNGRVMFLEFKRPGGKLSRHQKQWIEKLRNKGQAVFVADSLDLAKTLVEKTWEFTSTN